MMNSKKSNIFKILIPIILILLVVIIFGVVHFISGNKLLRGVSWGQSVNSVVKQEQKKDSSADISVSDNKIFISPVTIYDRGGAKLWYYFDDDKLNKILVRYENCYKDEDFSSISNSVANEFGEPVTEKQNYMTWSLKDTFISLEYDSSHYSIDLTLKKQ